MSLDLAFDDGQIVLADALAQFCRERCDDDVVRAASDSFPRALWSELASLGVLAAGAPGGEGGALEVCAAMEALGAAVFPGPLSATFLAMQLLEGAERDAVADGGTIVSCGEPPLMPFATEAGLFLEIVAGAVHRSEPAGEIEPVEVLGGEPWGRVSLRRGPALAGGARAITMGEIALAAYLAGAGHRLVEDVAEHARTRQQFGRSIGEFQAVAHPLADCRMRLDAARTLARAAAFRFDLGGGDAVAQAAAAARLSCAGAAIDAVHAGHQIYGAIGITLEGPAFHVTRRIRQLASQAPGPGPARERMLETIGLEGA